MSMHRPLRIMIGGKRWRSRLLFIAGGLAVGLAAVTLAWLADEAQRLFHMLIGVWPYAPLVVTPLGFAIAAYITVRYIPAAAGSGIPQASLVARNSQDQGLRARMVSLKIAFGKIFLLTLGLLSGASVGREGPTVQIGASIMFAASRFAPARQKGFVLAGAAAGVAAAFNTPLAGVVFAIEELSRSFEVRTSGLVLGTIVAAGLTSLAIVGDYTYFGFTPAALTHWRDWLAVPLAGLAGGVGGGLFSHLLANPARLLPGVAGRWLLRHPILFALICGVVVALCGLASGNMTFGTGYEQARSILHGDTQWSDNFSILKFIATVASSASGIPGGIFAPSLSIGAGIGANLHTILPGVPIGALGLLGMVAFLSGVVQAPITAFVIVAEMTENHALVIPLMLTAVTASAVAKLVTRQGLYHQQARVLSHKNREKHVQTPLVAEKPATPKSD